MTDPHASRAACSILKSGSRQLVEDWIEWVQSRIPTESTTALPVKAIRNHIPPILECLADFIEQPSELTKNELVGHLRLHGQIRRDQGYSLQEILGEFEGLSDMVVQKVRAGLQERADDFEVEDVMEALVRLQTGLRAVVLIATGTFNATQRDRDRVVYRKLEEFSRTVIHELRGPINTLGLHLGLLERGSLPHGDHVATMRVAIGRLDHLLETIRMLAVVEGARAGRRLMTLREGMTWAQREFGEWSEQAGVQIRCDAEMPEVSLESIVLYIVLANLLSNSLKYSDPNRSNRYVEISAEFVPEDNDTGFLELVVRDNGIGIEPDVVKRVWQPGVRAAPDRGDGTGLGLSLIQETVLSRGGTIDLASEPGQGTTVRVGIRCLKTTSSLLTSDDFSVEQLVSTRLSQPSTDTPAAAEEGSLTGGVDTDPGDCRAFED